MKRILPIIFIAIVLSAKAMAQCNANFTYSINQNQVSFTAGSAYQTASHTWFFGDASGSYQVNPVHYYNQPGTYTVVHIVQDSLHGCVDSVFKTVTLNFQDSCNINASFTWFADTAYSPLHIIFTASPNQPQLNYWWFFGDGNNGWGTPVSHTYSYPGTYGVTLVVFDSATNCMDSIRQYITVTGTVDSCNINASFNYTANAANTLQLQFTASPNQPQLDYWWHFGDGYNGWGNPVSHSYNQPGNYWVTLVVYDSITQCMDSTGKYVTVTRPVDSCNLNASFTYSVTPANTSLVQFTASPNQPQLVYNWHFGDGYNGWGNPVSHNYNQPGNYWVVLVVYDSATRCMDSVWKYITVTRPVDSCNLNNSFTYTVDSTNNLQVHFNAFPNNPRYIHNWNFGDGHNGWGASVSHTYSQPGSYFVYLSTFDSLTRCNDSTWHTVTLVGDSCAGPCDSLNIRNVNRRAVVPSYPNPVQSESTIRFNLTLDAAAVITFKVTNLSGNTVYQSRRAGQQGTNVISVPVSQLGRGQYFIDIMYGNNQRRSIFQKL